MEGNERNETGLVKKIRMGAWGGENDVEKVFE